MGRMLGQFIIIFSFCFVCVAPGYCLPWGKKAAPVSKQAPVKEAASQEVVMPEKAQPEVATPKPSVEAKKASAVQAKVDVTKVKAMREKKRKEINETQWPIEIVALSGKGSKQKDVLVFKENKLFSDEYAKKGFMPSNYTLSFQENGPVVVETMQTSDKEGIAFWRVELDQSLSSCKGVVSRQFTDNKTEDYSFASSGPKVPAALDMPTPAGAVPVASNVAATVKEEIAEVPVSETAAAGKSKK